MPDLDALDGEERAHPSLGDHESLKSSEYDEMGLRDDRRNS